jgi:hypothetical protein
VLPGDALAVLCPSLLVLKDFYCHFLCREHVKVKPLHFIYYRSATVPKDIQILAFPKCKIT